MGEIYTRAVKTKELQQELIHIVEMAVRDTTEGIFMDSNPFQKCASGMVNASAYTCNDSLHRSHSTLNTQRNSVLRSKVCRMCKICEALLKCKPKEPSYNTGITVGDRISYLLNFDFLFRCAFAEPFEYFHEQLIFNPQERVR